MKTLKTSELAITDIYKLLIGSIIPRPIAWVSTLNKNGASNLAPFSFFNAVCSAPPTLLFCPVNHPDGREKDTLVNIRETKEFVVNVSTEKMVQKITETSANLPYGTSEFSAYGIQEAKSLFVKPPRVLESPISFECTLNQIVDIGSGGAGSGHIVVGHIVAINVDESVYDQGKIKADVLNPVARLGGQTYSTLGKLFDIERPK